MQLPNGDAARVPTGKLTHYLLDESHSDGKSKASVLIGIGFSRRHPGQLAQQLLAIAERGEVLHSTESAYGTKYIIDGVLTGPSGRSIVIRTVWLIAHDDPRPRLVTAYPRRRRS